MTDPDNEVQKRLKLKEEWQQMMLPIVHLGGDEYQFGKNYKTLVKMINDELYAQMNGGYVPLESFVKNQYPEILMKERRPGVDAKDKVRELRVAIEAFT